MTPTITRTPTPTSPLRGPRVSYAGAIAQDGCSFCCEFICQGSPTPTPFIDDQGREVFVRTAGTFMFVVEGTAGASHLPPGATTQTDLQPAGDDRGPLQVLVSRDIGDGSPAKCDMGPPPTPFGGVPGINPPNFGSSQQVTDAIQDIECRFDLHTTSAFACTRNPSGGDFSFISCAKNQITCGQYTQFCFQVPLTAEFHIGDTAVGIQLRDGAGNIGPKKEIVIRVLQ